MGSTHYDVSRALRSEPSSNGFGTERVHPSQSDAKQIQQTMHRSGRTTPAVAGRSRRRAESKKKDNHGTTFLLGEVNFLTKWAWCVPLKNKSMSSLVTAFKGLMTDVTLTILQTDKAFEFLNRSVYTVIHTSVTIRFIPSIHE